MDKNIDNVLKQMNNIYQDNVNTITNTYGSLDYTDKYGNTLYHLIVQSKVIENYKLLAILTLIKAGIDPNTRNMYGDTFLHTAIKEKIYPAFLDEILLRFKSESSLPIDYEIQNNEGNNVMHIALKYCDTSDGLMEYLKIFKKYHFDFTKETKDGINCIDIIKERYAIPYQTRQDLLELIDNKTNSKSNKKTISKTKNIDKYGTILNNKTYNGPVALGRDDEINKIIVSLAGNKLPILIGPSGVGKTTIIDELTYRIGNNQVPRFLKDKIIYEVHMANILAGTKYRGSFEENLKEIFDFVIKNNAILFIDEFHMAFGAGSSEYDKSDAASMLKTYIDRYNLQVIGATTEEEYHEYMANDALKRRFDVVKINELADNKLYNIILNRINNLSITKLIELDTYFEKNIDEIISILLELTNDRNRIYNDKVYNPDLLISLIDRAFAYVIAQDDNILEVKHLILSINDNERIYPSAKEIAIKHLNNLSNINNLPKTKIISLDEYKKKHIHI